MAKQKSKSNNELRNDVLIERQNTKDQEVKYLVSRDQLKEALEKLAIKHQSTIELRKERMDLKQKLLTTEESLEFITGLHESLDKLWKEANKKLQEFEKYWWFQIGVWFVNYLLKRKKISRKS